MRHEVRRPLLLVAGLAPLINLLQLLLPLLVLLLAAVHDMREQLLNLGNQGPRL